MTTDSYRRHMRASARVGAIATALTLGLGLGLATATSASAATLPAVNQSWLDFYFNNKGIGSDAAGDAPNLDGAGKGFHRANLNTGGQTSGGLVVGSEVSVPGEPTLKYVTAGAAVGPYQDNVEADGQTIDTSVALGSASAHAATKIALVWTAHNASDIATTPTFTFHYAGGTTGTAQLPAADWCSDGNASNTLVAARQSRYGDTAQCTIFASKTVTLTGVLDAITFPDEDRIHVFAIASDADTSNATDSSDGGASVSIPQTVTVGDAIAPTVTWAHGEPASVSGQWVLDGAPISVGVSQRMVVPPSWVGKHLTYQVSGRSPGYAPTATVSSGDVVVAPGVLSTALAPSLTGLARVGDTLVANPGQYATGSEQATSVGTSIAWLADGTVIAGATGTTFVPAAAQVGKRISARVTATKLGYTTVVTTTTASSPVLAAGVDPYPAAPSQPDPLVAITRAASVSGMPRVGASVSAAPGAYAPAAAVSYQWLRGSSVIPGATARTYRLVPADLGAVVSVRVTAAAAGRQPVVQVLTAGVGQAGTIAAKKPAVKLKKKTVKHKKVHVGARLKAVPGKIASPRGSVRKTYQWYAGKDAISGKAGKKKALKVKKKYLGAKLRVRVTLTADGYAAITKASPNTGKVVR